MRQERRAIGWVSENSVLKLVEENYRERKSHARAELQQCFGHLLEYLGSWKATAGRESKTTHM